MSYEEARWQEGYAAACSDISQAIENVRLLRRDDMGGVFTRGIAALMLAVPPRPDDAPMTFDALCAAVAARVALLEAVAMAARAVVEQDWHVTELRDLAARLAALDAQEGGKQ